MHEFVLSCVRLSATPRTVAFQAPLSMESSRQKYWSGLPFPSPWDLPDPGTKPGSPTLQADSLPRILSRQGSPKSLPDSLKDSANNLRLCRLSLTLSSSPFQLLSTTQSQKAMPYVLGFVMWISHFQVLEFMCYKLPHNKQTQTLVV